MQSQPPTKLWQQLNPTTHAMNGQHSFILPTWRAILWHKMKDESESTIALILPLLLSPSLFWCLITYTTVLFFGLLAWAQIRSRNAKKLQMITWLESTNRIQVIMWHLSFYWWIQVMWSLAVLHSDFCWASNPKTHYHGTQCLTYYVICQRTELTWKSEDDQSELRWCHLWWSV